MRAVRIAAIALGSLAVLYFLAINLIPEGMIVGIHFRWPWK
jgi:threonine/homoserine efflux transporter RhtA